MSVTHPMFDTICTLPLEADLFAQAVHPAEPLLTIGLSNGQVETLRLPSVEDESRSEKNAGRRGSNGTDIVDTGWKTRRHKGSCRCLAFSLGGKSLYSAGTDGIVKAADVESGRVIGKVALPLDPSSNSGDIDAPTVLHALSPQTLLVAADSGALHLYDLRDPAPSVSTAIASGGKQAFTGMKAAQTHYPHTDYVSSLTPLPPSSTSTSGFSKQWLTTGGSTLALTDLRRGVLVKSEDQEEELLSSLYVTGLASKKASGSTGEKALVGGSDGVITLWEKGQWDDQDERIIVSREKETVDALVAVPSGVGGGGKLVAAGLGDGEVRFVRLGANKVVSEVQHDELEGVIDIGFDVGGRMITGGGQNIKVWEEHVEAEEDDGDKDAIDDEDGDEDDEVVRPHNLKRTASSDDDSDDEKESGAEEEVEKLKKRRKKRKRGKGPVASTGLSFSGLD